MKQKQRLSEREDQEGKLKGTKEDGDYRPAIKRKVPGGDNETLKGKRTTWKRKEGRKEGGMDGRKEGKKEGRQAGTE